MTASASAFLLFLGSSPWAKAIAIILSTFIAEDVAIIAAALLAADGMLVPSLALTSLIIGIFAGDLGLYGLGAAARSQSWARRLIGEQRMAKGHAWLSHRYIAALIGARFLPGFRLPTYSASGFLQLPLLPFAMVSAIAGFIWTSFIFALVFYFGLMSIEMLGAWRWLIALALAVLIFTGPRLTERFIAMKETPRD